MVEVKCHVNKSGLALPQRKLAHIVLVVVSEFITYVSRPLQFDLDHESLQESQENTLMIEEKAKPKQYYRFWVLPGKWLRVRYDRLALLALLDR